MGITANMSLTTWPDITDVFDHAALAANFGAIDTHDHTSGKGVKVGTGGLANLTVGTAQIQETAVITSKLADLSVTTAKLANLGVTTGKIADVAVTSGKIEVTVVQALHQPGDLKISALAVAPSGWLLCDGSAVSRSGATLALFNAIGTSYGVGNNTTTFNVPDLRGRFPVGRGTHSQVDELGKNEGLAVASRTPSHAHTVGSHTHTVTINSAGTHIHQFLDEDGNGPGNLSWVGANSGAFNDGTFKTIFWALGGTGYTPGTIHDMFMIPEGDHTHSASTGAAGATTSAGANGSFEVINYFIKT